MSLPIEKLDAAAIPLDKRILAFLTAEPTKAFTLWEIFSDLEGHDASTAAMLILVGSPAQRQALVEPYSKALAELTKNAQIRTAEVRGSKYFALPAALPAAGKPKK